MKRLRPTVFVLIAAVFGVLPLYRVDAEWLGLDWNAEIRNDYELRRDGDDVELSSLDALFFVLSMAHSTDGPTIRYRISGGIGYAPQLGRISVDEGDRELIAFSGPTTVTVRWNPGTREGRWIAARLGRLELDDPSGLLFTDPRALYPTQLVDGLGLEIRDRRWFLGIDVGYTGLLDKDVNRVQLSTEDLDDAVDEDVFFGPQRILGTINAQAESLFWLQDGGLTAAVVQDVRGNDEDVSAYYFGPIVSGPLGTEFSHAQGLIASFTNSTTDDTTGVGLLYFLDLNYAVPIAQLNDAWLAIRYASSDGDSLVQFPNPAGPDIGAVLQHPLSDLVAVQLGLDTRIDVQPARSFLSPSLATTLFLIPGEESAPGSEIEPSGTFGGVEVEAGIEFLIRNDLLLSASSAWHFLDGTARPAARFLGRIYL